MPEYPDRYRTRDVFSLGLIMYRMLAGQRPEWPYDWPPPGHAQLRRKVHPDLIAFLRRAVDPNPRKRFRDADQMLNVFRKVKGQTLRYALGKREKRRYA